MLYIIFGLVVIILLKVLELIRMCSDMNRRLNTLYAEFVKLVYTDSSDGATGEDNSKKSGVLEVSAKEYRKMVGLE